ncbi:uncharacterized protein JCM6883_004024 [Sporobolomyces salmoneus]|uniref:uncharacterized protein n=1 Tax=Sporobolomyces salmoneus TaxID=183962 RepID=UPI00316D03B1
MSTRSIPPELLTMIIRDASECDSTYDSYKDRFQTLSSLSLVNTTFREIARPLFAQKIYLKGANDLRTLSGERLKGKISSLTFEDTDIPSRRPSAECFALSSEWRIFRGSPIMLRLNNHQREVSVATYNENRAKLIMVLSVLKDVTRLALESCQLREWKQLFLPQLVELSLNGVTIRNYISFKRWDNLLSISRFPFLRALAIRGLSADSELGSQATVVEYRLLLQLDCIVADRVYLSSRQLGIPQPVCKPLSYPMPFLHTYGPHPIEKVQRVTSHTRKMALSETHVRLHLERDRSPSPRPREIKDAFSFVEILLNESTVLEEIYLDLYPRDGKRGFVLDEKLAELIRRFEDQARKSNADIIWESHEDDWCNSLVSKEFWRRSKEKKEKEEKRERDEREEGIRG